MTVQIKIDSPSNNGRWITKSASTSDKVSFKANETLQGADLASIPNFDITLTNELALNAKWLEGTESIKDFHRFIYLIGKKLFPKTTPYTQFMKALGSQVSWWHRGYVCKFFKQHGNQSILFSAQKLIMKIFTGRELMPVGTYKNNEATPCKFTITPSTDKKHIVIKIAGQYLLPIAGGDIRKINYTVTVTGKSGITTRHIAVGLLALTALGGLGAYLHRANPLNFNQFAACLRRNLLALSR